MDEIKYCLNCGDHLELTPGRKAKNYCSNNCKQRHWQKMKKEGPKQANPAAKTKKASASSRKGETPANEPKTTYDALRTTKIQDEPDFRKGQQLADAVFMGIEIPKGLKGIELSIWKAEIKEKILKTS